MTSKKVTSHFVKKNKNFVNEILKPVNDKCFGTFLLKSEKAIVVFPTVNWILE